MSGYFEDASCKYFPTFEKNVNPYIQLGLFKLNYAIYNYPGSSYTTNKWLKVWQYLATAFAHVLFTLFVFVCAQWCPTHIVLWFCFVCFRLVSCVPYVASFSRFFILIVPSVFSNVYLLIIKHGKIYSKNAIFRLRMPSRVEDIEFIICEQ